MRGGAPWGFPPPGITAVEEETAFLRVPGFVDDADDGGKMRPSGSGTAALFGVGGDANE